MNLSEAGALGDPTLAGKQLPSPPPLKPVGACLGTQALGCLKTAGNPARELKAPGRRRSAAGPVYPGPPAPASFFEGVLGRLEESGIRCDVGIVPLEVPPDREQVRRSAQSLNHCQFDFPFSDGIICKSAFSVC